jgi:hypothetical protein
MRLCALFLALSLFGSSETFRNEKVAIVTGSIPPGGVAAAPAGLPSVLVYRKDGSAVFLPPGKSTVKNTGASELEFVRVDFLGTGEAGGQPWGTSGLSPNYKLLIENQYARVYDIKIPAHTNEPQHTHKDRVVVCLSGAQLEHLLPDGRREPSTLKTGEVGWRRGGTHIGQNLGNSDLWVIAIEPK